MKKVCIYFCHHYRLQKKLIETTTIKDVGDVSENRIYIDRNIQPLNIFTRIDPYVKTIRIIFFS